MKTKFSFSLHHLIASIALGVIFLQCTLSGNDTEQTPSDEGDNLPVVVYETSAEGNSLALHNRRGAYPKLLQPLRANDYQNLPSWLQPKGENRTISDTNRNMLKPLGRRFSGIGPKENPRCSLLRS